MQSANSLVEYGPRRIIISDHYLIGYLGVWYLIIHLAGTGIPVSGRRIKGALEW